MKNIIFISMLLIFTTLIACKTADLGGIEQNLYTITKTEVLVTNKKSGTDKLISTNYSYQLEQTPSTYDANVVIKIVGESQLSYQTEKTVKTVSGLKKIVNNFATFSLFATAGGATLAYNKYKGGYFLMTFGILSYTSTLMLPREMEKQDVQSGETKYETKTNIIPEENTLVTVTSGDKVNKYYTDKYGKIKFHVANDFEYINFETKKDINFEIKMNETTLKNKTNSNNFIVLSNDLWTERLVKVISSNAKVYDIRNNVIKSPLLGTVYKVKPGLYYNNYETTINGKNGYIHKDFVKEMYIYNYQENTSDKEAIRMYVEAKIEEWQQKDEFESTKEWADRINYQRPLKITEFTNEALIKYQEELISEIKWNNAKIVGIYDPDNETFCIHIPQLDTIYLNVKRADDEAKKFKANFNVYQTLNPIFKIYDSKWKLFELTFFNTIDSTFYKYSSSESVKYDPNKEFDLKIKNIELLLEEEEKKTTEKENTLIDDKYDIEANLPTSTMDNSNSFAYLIGNKNYKNEGVKDVEYAINDINSVKKYLIEVLGYKEENITAIEDASFLQMQKIFGLTGKPGRISTDIKSFSNIFIYYSGHGAPAMDKKAYLAPVDAEVNDLEFTAYPLDLLYENIAKINTTGTITVVIDACFSGVDFTKHTSDLVFVPEISYVENANIAILNASSEDQPAHWFEMKQHGMFTYFFLKALHNREKSDTNKNGELTYKEIADYINDIDNGLPYFTRRIFNGAKQNAILQGGNTNGTFIKY